MVTAASLIILQVLIILLFPVCILCSVIKTILSKYFSVCLCIILMIYVSDYLILAWRNKLIMVYHCAVLTYYCHC